LNARILPELLPESIGKPASAVIAQRADDEAHGTRGAKLLQSRLHSFLMNSMQHFLNFASSASLSFSRRKNSTKEADHLSPPG
jgi:hypothetical protein